jgi:protein SCO1
MKAVCSSILLFFFVALTIPIVFAAESVPVELQAVGIDEHLGSGISLTRKFMDEQGRPVKLQNYFDGTRPVILTLVYFTCPNLCNFLLNAFTDSLKKMSWNVGDQFQVVTISIDPRETPDLAAKKKGAYIQEYGRPSAPAGWHFLTGSETEIKGLAQEVGFKYTYDKDQKEFAHAAALFVLTPEGKLSRYLYGIEFNPRDLRLALLEAGQGKIGSLVDRFLMFCYHYDPKGRKYALMAINLMKLGGAVAVAGLAVLLFTLSRSSPQVRKV